MYYIYMHRNEINNKIYIGQTCQSPPNKRWYPSNYAHSPCFYNAIQKYGWSNFSHIILEDNLTLEEANEREAYWIKFYNTLNRKYGYNIRPGGNNAAISEETKKKMSLNHRDVKGEKNYFYGKHFTGEQHSMYGKHHTEKTKEKLRQANLNRNGKKVHCLTTNEYFLSAKEAGRKYHLSASHISECCRKNGVRHSCGKNPLTGEKMIWEYV